MSDNLGICSKEHISHLFPSHDGIFYMEGVMINLQFPLAER